MAVIIPSDRIGLQSLQITGLRETARVWRGSELFYEESKVVKKTGNKALGEIIILFRTDYINIVTVTLPMTMFS